MVAVGVGEPGQALDLLLHQREPPVLSEGQKHRLGNRLPPRLGGGDPGTGRPDHMRDNLAAGKGPFPDAAARERMAEYFDSL